MKTDTDDTIRVTITLRRESHPEWYGVLKNVRSGRDRAEIVRTHLTLPRAAAMAISAASLVPPAPRMRTENKTGTPPSEQIESFNSQDNSAGITETSELITTLFKNSGLPSENNSVNSPPQENQRSGGLASMLLDANLGPMRKS